MDFVSYIRDQSEKLNSREYLLFMWKELEGHKSNSEISDTLINNYNNHLPLLLDQFWENALEKLYQTDTTHEIDEELKIYLLVLIYKCITHSLEVVSYQCISNVSEVYLHLLTVQGDDFYKRKLYFTILNNLQKNIEAGAPQNGIIQLLSKLRHFLKKGTLSTSDLEFTLAALIKIILLTTNKTIQISSSTSPTSIPLEALTCLKIIYKSETLPKRKCIIITYLFNGLRGHASLHLTPARLTSIQTNFRSLIKILFKKFENEDFTIFLNAFIHVWRHPDFAYFDEAVLIMNLLSENYYQNLLAVLNKSLMTKHPHKNLIELAVSVICNPPEFTTINQAKVANELLFKNILLHSISSKSEISNISIESLAAILNSSHLEKEFIQGPVKNVFNCINCENLSVPIFLNGLESLLSKSWGSRSRNKYLFVIIISIMAFSEEDYPVMYKKILENLTDQCSPYDLKPYISLLSQTYLKMLNRNHNFSALQIFKVLFKMALHPMATASEFVKHLYSGMLFHNSYKGLLIRNEFYIDPLISEDLNFSEFFQKCHTLGLIKYEHVAKLFRNISTLNKSNMKLLCAIIHLTDFNELAIIADHINDNFMTICNLSDLNYLLYIYNQIIKFNKPSESPQNLRCNSSMVTFLKYHLLRQTFRWNCVANAFSLLKTLKDFTNWEEDINSFKEEYDRNLTLVLESKSSFLPILYFSQLVVFGKVLPNEDNLRNIVRFLELNTDEYCRSPDFNPKIWIGCLMLYTNISVIKSSLVDSCLDYLQNGLRCSLTFIKLASLNLIFDLSNMVTHNFDSLIQYMFKQLVYGDTIFKKTCLLKIDRLMRDDYLKLDLEQFFIFVSVLSDRNEILSDYAKKLFYESFFVNNSTMIARFFVPLIVHSNGYKKHPNYRLCNNSYHLVQLVYGNLLNKETIYNLLFTNLPLKNQFTVLNILSTQVLENILKKKIPIEEGFWKMFKDSIFIFKTMTTKGNEDETGTEFNKKIVTYISKYILNRLEYSDKPQYLDYQKELIKSTEILLKLLFLSDTNNVQHLISIQIFETVISWTSYFLADLIYIVHRERNKEIQSYFSKFEQFYNKNKQNLVHPEKSFQMSQQSSFEASSSSRSLFNSSEDYIPEFDNS